MKETIKKIKKFDESIQIQESEKRINVLSSSNNVIEISKIIKETGFNHIECVSGTDFPDSGEIEVAYFIGSTNDELKDKVVTITSRVNRDKPKFPTLTGIWMGTEFHERETWEMLGVEFQNHPGLTKLLLPDDWKDIPPLRKDFHNKKWGDSERERVGLDVKRGSPRGRIEEEVIPNEVDIEEIRNPKFIQEFLDTAAANDSDILGGQLQQSVKTNEKTMAISFGVQHPGSGHMRLVLGIDGDIITNCEPDIGYVHRGEEKMCEYKNYFQNIPHLERPVIHDSCGILFPYVLAVEDLLEITDKIPERAKYIRIIMAELNRIISHMYWLGIMGIFTGHSTMFMWAMGDREMIIEAASKLGGARVTFAYFTPGGVRNDTPPGFEEYMLEICDKFEDRLEQYNKIFFQNSLFQDRTQKVGILNDNDAINWGAVGPALRGSNVNSDVRKDDPYGNYELIDFDVPVMKEGDSYARSMVSYLEMYESIKIIRKAIQLMKPGPVKVPMRGAIRMKEGETYVRTEAAHGAMSYYIISKAKPQPYRVRISVPSFRNLLPLVRQLLPGQHVSDVPVIHWSLNYWAVEGDR